MGSSPLSLFARAEMRGPVAARRHGIGLIFLRPSGHAGQQRQSQPDRVGDSYDHGTMIVSPGCSLMFCDMFLPWLTSL